MDTAPGTFAKNLTGRRGFDCASALGRAAEQKEANKHSVFEKDQG